MDRRDATGQSMFSVHDSVDAAQRRFSVLAPLKLVWEPGCRCCLCLTDEDCDNDGTCAIRRPETG